MVANRGEPKGILIFKRTDNGNVAPKAIISGPKTGMDVPKGLKRFAIYPEGKKIFALVRGGVGVWNYSDNGDVPPYVMIRAQAGAVALNPEAKEIIVDGSGAPPSVQVYHVPEAFEE